MNKRKAFEALALLLVFSLLPFSSGTALAANLSTANAALARQATGKLATSGNQPILVNGISTNSGATILSGSNIETGDQVGATIDLGGLGSVDIAPNTKLQLNFSSDGTVTINLAEGCVILRVKQGTYGVINTSQGEATHNDSIKRPAAVLDVCLPKGAPAAIVNQGAAANAGAGAGATGGTVASEGLSGAVVGTLVAGAAGLGVIAIIL
ncbi:MAG TPA: hypothetical protein VF766_11175, partial [Pyrinomonadaceae bacterium]